MKTIFEILAGSIELCILSTGFLLASDKGSLVAYLLAIVLIERFRGFIMLVGKVRLDKVE